MKTEKYVPVGFIDFCIVYFITVMVVTSCQRGSRLLLLVQRPFSTVC